MTFPPSRRAIALFIAAAVVLISLLLLPSGPVVGCLGPLGVTQVECTLGYNIAHDPDWSPDPGLGGVLATAVVGLVLAGVALTRQGLSRPTAGLLALVAAAGAVAGALVYEATRLRVLSGSTSSGRFLSIEVPSNPDSLMVGAIAGAALAVSAAGIANRVLGRRRALAGG